MTTGVDTFSFGIMMWELYTGHSAYKGMGRDAIIDRVYKKQSRPQFPAGTPVMYAQLAQTCWGNDAITRPSFHVILQRLGEMLQVFHTGSYMTIGGEAGGSAVSDTSTEPLLLQQQQQLLPQQQLLLPQLRPQQQQHPAPGFMHVQVGSFAGYPHVVFAHPLANRNTQSQQEQQQVEAKAGSEIQQQQQQQAGSYQPRDLDQPTLQQAQQYKQQQNGRAGSSYLPQAAVHQLHHQDQQDHGQYSGSMALDALADVPQPGGQGAGPLLGKGLSAFSTPAVANAVAKALAGERSALSTAGALTGGAVVEEQAAMRGDSAVLAAAVGEAVPLSQPAGVQEAQHMAAGPVPGVYGPGAGKPSAIPGGFSGVNQQVGGGLPEPVLQGAQQPQMSLEQWTQLCQQQQQQQQYHVLPPQLPQLLQQQVLLPPPRPLPMPQQGVHPLGPLAPQQEMLTAGDQLQS